MQCMASRQASRPASLPTPVGPSQLRWGVGRRWSSTHEAMAILDKVICWLTGYSPEALAEQIERGKDVETFFSEAPALHPDASRITGVVCGVRIEDIEDPLMRNVR